MTLKMNLNLNVGAQVNGIVFDAMQEVFELDIKPDAVEMSPVSETWPSIPASRGEPRIDTGANKRSIDVEVKKVDNGVQGQIFTQSNHGAYLEGGTSRMPARPYLYPALIKNIDKFAEVIGLKVKAASE